MIGIESAYIFALGSLSDKRGKGHKDPFDRMLIAQDGSENMMFVTRDKRLHAYEESCVKYL